MSWRQDHTSHKSHISATTEQAQALSLLRNESSTNILAYTKHARSLTHRVNQGAGHGLLSNEQLDAIDTLSSCREDEVRTLLERPHVPWESETWPGPDWSGLTPTLPATAQQPVSGPTHEIAVSQQHATYGPHAQYLDQPRRPYSCTVCPRSYQNHFDWKKHEKEHEYTYTCMASGHWDATAQAFVCIHCRVPDPEEKHLRAHGMERCNTQNKRREKIVKHLKDYHMVSDRAVGESLADNWRCDQGKKFWACGFCGNLFLSFRDRLQHIGREHYDQGQKFEEWDANKVIHGLLLQPRVYAAWKDLVDPHSFHNVSELTWETSEWENLQQMLEIGPTDEKSAESLAKAAYRASKTSSQTALEPTIGPSNKFQYPFPPELSSTRNNSDNDVSFKRLPTTAQQFGVVPTPVVSPLGNYDSSTTFYSGSDPQARIPAEDRGVMEATTLFSDNREDYQDWATDPILSSEPGVLKDDDAMDFVYTAGQH